MRVRNNTFISSLVRSQITLTEAKVTMKTKSINLPRPGDARRILCLISLAAALSAGNLAAANVSFDITNLGQNLYRYNYTVSGIQFQVNQELDIRFDPAKYGTLSNGIAPAGFDLLLLQP